MAHGPSIVVSEAGSLARWPIEPGRHRPIPQGHGCGEYVSTSTPVRSIWAVVSYGQPDGWLFLVSVGFCLPGLNFSTLNGRSEPVGLWMWNNYAQLTVNHSNSSSIVHGEPYGKPWAVGANVSATIIDGDNGSSSLVQFAVDGVLQGPAVPMGIAVPAEGLLGCATACANSTALVLAT